MKKTLFLNFCFILAALIPLGVLLSVFFFSQPNDLRQPVSEEKAGVVSTAVVEGAQSPFAPTVIPLQERVTMKPPLDDEDLPQELSTLDGLKDAPTLEDNQEEEDPEAAPKDDDSFLDLNKALEPTSTWSV